MKSGRILSFALVALLALCGQVEAQSTRTQATRDLMGLGMPGQLAEKVAGLATGLGVISNNAYLSARNAADSANISVLKVDATDDTVLNADTGDTVKIAVAGTTEATFNDDSLTFSATNMDIIFGTSGVFKIGSTAELTLTNDQIAFAGAAAEIVPGATSLTFKNNADNAVNLSIADAGAITFRDTLIGTGTGTLGWAVVAGANTACTTTCTTPCVFGVNTAATEADIVGCSDATADECLCAGAS